MKILKCFWFFVFKILFVLKVKLFTFNSERKSPRTMSAVQPHHNLKIHRKGLISNFDWSLDFVSLVSCLHGTWKPNKKTQFLKNNYRQNTHTHTCTRGCACTQTHHTCKHSHAHSLNSNNSPQNTAIQILHAVLPEAMKRSLIDTSVRDIIYADDWTHEYLLSLANCCTSKIRAKKWHLV